MRKPILSIFAIAVFLLGANTGFSQTPPTFTVCPGFPGLILPAGDGGLTLNSSNIPSLLGVTAVDPDGAETITYSASPSFITCADIGPNFAIAVTATDSDGSDVCNITVDVFDGGPFAVCNDITIHLDAGGNWVLTGAEEMALAAGSSACTGISSISVAPNTFDCTDIGAPVQVSVTVEDANTATAFCLANVTVLDELPVALCVAPFNLPLDGSGNASITTGDIDNGSTVGSCGALGLSLDVSNFDCSDVGPNTVTLTVDDGNGQSITCSTTVTIQDNQVPVANCNDITVTLDATGNYTLTAANLTALSAGSTDNCPLTTSSSQTMFDCTDIGGNTVTITVSDGTNSDNCMANITVQDNTAPVIANCPANSTTTTSVGGTGDCEGDFTWTHPTVTDNCTANLTMTYTLSGATVGGPTAFTSGASSGAVTFNIGVTTVTYSVSDGTNAGAPICSFTVTTTDDEAPMAINPGNMTVNNTASQCEATVAWPTLTGTDNCPGLVTVTYMATDPKGNPLTILTAGLNDFADFPVGVSTVNYSVSDAAMPMNTANGSFTVTVNDNEAPVITCPASANILFSSCSASTEMVPDYRGNASISDNCTGYSVTQSPAPGTLLSSLGGVTPANGESFMVTLTVTDGFANNLTDDCTFTVNLSENDAPEPTTPGGILPTIDFTCGPAVFIMAAPTATDACGNLICGEPFPGGIAIDVGPPCTGGGAGGTTTYNSTDTPVALPDNNPTGNTSTLNVVDPNLIITDVNVTLDIDHTWVGDLQATLTSPDGTTVELFDRPGVPAGTFGCAGNDLDVTFDDEAGSTAATFETSCANLPAISGSFQPIIPLSMFDGENPNGDWILTVSDNAGGDLGSINAWSLDIETQSTATSITNYQFPVGMHSITWVYDDGLGNVSNQLQQINISNDVVLPVVSCQDITLELDGSGNASLAADELLAPTAFYMEMTEDFADNANNPGRVNMSVTATSNTTFTFDWDYNNSDPGFEALTYYVNGGPLPNGNVITAASGTGTTSVPLLAGDVFTIEILTIDNLFGETSSVVIDNFNQGFTGDYSLGNWTLFVTGAFLTDFDILDGIPTDDCSDLLALEPTLSASQTAFDCSDIGAAIPVTLSVTDEAGNVGTCTAMVTIVDALAPALSLISGSVTDFTTDCNIPAPNATITANDNCDGSLPVTLTETDDQSNNPSSCAFYNYTITRTWEATDANSNTGSIVQTVTVEDVSAPTNPTYNAGAPSGIISTDAIGCTASVSLAILDFDDCAAFADLTITNNSLFALAGGADASGDYPIGTHNVGFTATDPCGNTSNWFVNFTVEDLVAPVASCVNDLNLGLPGSGVLTLSPNAVDNNSYDECSGVTLTVSPNTFTCADIGMPHAVTLTATDAAGNFSSCTTTVNIQDNNVPTAICQSITVSLDENGNAFITGADIDNGSFDDCTGVTLSVTPNSFTEADLGNNTVTLTVTDDYNNSSNCNANVLVQLPPTCFDVGIASGGAGEVISVPITSDNFTALVGFQFELQMNQPSAGEFVGVSGIHPDLTNVFQENLIVTDSFISNIDSMIVMGSMGQDSTVYDTLYDYNHDLISVSWVQFNAIGEITLPDGTTLFNIDILLTGNIGDFSIISLNPGSMTTPPQVVYSFGSGFIPAPACVNQGAVTIGELIIAGDIYNESGEAINMVTVDLFPEPSFPPPLQTDVTMTDGAYEFVLSAPGNYRIQPSKDINWSNGIDILDVSFIQRHSVGNPYVDSPYKKIAADVSGEGAITTFDAVLLNAYLASLFLAPPPPTPSWQFSDAKDVLPNTPDAFIPAFNDNIVILGITSDSVGNDFVAIKTGDLGGLVGADTLLFGDDPDDRNDDVLKFVTEDRALKAGDNISIDWSAENFEQMMAYQWILEFDNEVLAYKGFDNVNLDNLGALGFGEVIIEEGKLVMTWFNGADITKSPEELLFSLNFEVIANADHLSDLLSVTTYDRFDAVAYKGNETAMEIELVFTQPKTQPSIFALNQNTPNPFKDETVISFTLPEASDATLSIMDITGRVLKKYQGNFAQGYNEVSINRSDIPDSGTLFYELKTPEHTASMKMIIID